MFAKKSLFSIVSEDPTRFGMELAAMGREHPVYFDEVLGLPVVLRSADINAVLRDEQTYSTRVFQNGLMKDALIASHGEEHTRMRKLYNSFFAPQQVRRYEEHIVVPAVREVIDRLAAQSDPDLVDHFCMEVPQRVVATLFNLPIERIAENDVLVRTILRAIVSPFDPELVAAGERAYAAMADDLHQIAARELEQPSASMLGEIAKALIAEGLGTVEACERIVFTLILGSYETTIWGLASVMSAMLRYPDARARVRDNPELLPAAIEEAWRWCGSTLGTVRYVERETELAGNTLATGSVIHLAFAAPNYEADVFPNPEVYDIDRKSRTMLFGAGVHYCVGAPLARMETRVALAQLLARFPELRADPDRKAPVFANGTRGALAFGPDHLPVVLA
jgi:cytochrome P450